jgi:hypothetical protein
MMLEVNIPDEWPAELALATAQLIRHAVRDGLPIITVLRPDASPDQVSAIYARVQAVIQESGLAA